MTNMYPRFYRWLKYPEVKSDYSHLSEINEADTVLIIVKNQSGAVWGAFSTKLCHKNKGKQEGFLFSDKLRTIINFHNTSKFDKKFVEYNYNN